MELTGSLRRDFTIVSIMVNMEKGQQRLILLGQVTSLFGNPTNSVLVVCLSAGIGPAKTQATARKTRARNFILNKDEGLD